MLMESRIKVWWNVFKEEYDKDESNMYSAYAKSILLNWTNRITFANAIKKYHNCAYAIKAIDNTTSPEDGNFIIEKIVEILKKMNERQLNLVLLFVQSLK